MRLNTTDGPDFMTACRIQLTGWREPEGSSDHAVERSRFSPKAKEGKRNTLNETGFFSAYIRMVRRTHEGP
jgi:hypothetical protein